MSVRATSLEAYETIRDNGMLAASQFAAYEAVHLHGPMTANEIGEAIRQDKGWIAHRHNYNARCGELRDKGVFMELEERECRVTTSRAIVWAIVPNALPLVVPRKVKRASVPLDAEELQALVSLYAKGAYDEQAALLHLVKQTQGGAVARRISA